MRYTLKLFSPVLLLWTLLAFVKYLLTGSNSNLDYRIFRKTFAATNGWSNDFMSRLLSFLGRGVKKLDFNDLHDNGLVNSINSQEFNRRMKEDGFYVFEELVPKEVCDQLKKNLTSLTPMKLDSKSGKYIHVKNFPENIDSPRYMYNALEMLKLDIVKKLVLDRGIVKLASSYLDAFPICDLLASWWSFPSKDAASLSGAAQMFHFDMDRLKFIKFFIYLTPVGDHNGPHCYVRGSHKRLPFSLQEDRRFTNQEVNKFFGEDSILSIGGSYGQLIAVDTRGIHKGVPLVDGKRLIFQIEYSNSTFGHPYKKAEGLNRLGLNSSTSLRILSGVFE